MDLRKAFFDNLLEMAKADKSIRLLVCDLGYSFFERFQEELPDQFCNVGIAEQNAIGMASGMAMSGLKPYVYSGSIFLVMRSYEFIRNDVCFNNTNVKLIGTGASPFLGFTHNLQGEENEEDLLKNLPNIQRFYPKTEQELKQAMKINNKPTFIRL